MHGNTTISLQRTGSERKNSVGWDPPSFTDFHFGRRVPAAFSLNPGAAARRRKQSQSHRDAGGLLECAYPGIASHHPELIWNPYDVVVGTSDSGSFQRL